MVQVVFYKYKSYLECRCLNIGSLLRFNFNYETRDEKIEEYFEKVAPEMTIEKVFEMINEAEELATDVYEKEKLIETFKRNFKKEYSIIEI